MPRRTDAEIGKIVRVALRGHRLKRRRLYGDTIGDIIVRSRGGVIRKSPASQQCMESDSDFLENNNDAACAILESLMAKAEGR